MLLKENVQNETNIAVLAKPNDSTRDIIINHIIHLVKIMNVQVIEGWDDISFGNIEILKDQDGLTTQELSVLLNLLETMAGESRYQNYLEEYYLKNE